MRTPPAPHGCHSTAANHVLGDLARVYFSVLRGDGGVLFVE